MKITIDTKEDNKEEIKRVIQLLSGLVGEEVKVNKEFETESSGVSAFANLFGGEENKENKEDKFVSFKVADVLRGKTEKKKEDDFLKVVSY